MSMLDQMLANLYKPAKQEKPHTLPGKLPVHGVKSQALTQIAQTVVTQGQFLRGEVLDLRANQILVLLENGTTVSARTEGTLNLSIGETSRFFVAQTTEDQVLLKLAREDNETEHPMIEKALTAAGITRTEKSVSIVSELLSHSQPVTKANIRHYLSLSAKYPELPVKDFILMELHGIPVNTETVSRLTSYHDGNGKLLTQATKLLTELKTQIESLPEGEVKQQFLQELTTILTDSNAVKQPVRSDQVTVPDTTPVPQENSVADTTSLSVTQPDTPTDAQPDSPVLSKIPASMASPDTAPVSRSEHTPTEPVAFFKDFLDPFLLTPEEVANPERVKKHYKELAQKLETLEQFALKLAEHTKDTVISAPKQMKSNLSFMESVNQVFPFLQLPLKLTESPAHGELYVYERKKTLKPSDSFRALLHLDLEALGSMDVFITLAGQNVTSRFSLTDKASAELIRAELPILSDALAKKGYVLSSDVTVTESDVKEHTPTLLEQFLEEHAPGGLSRYTFDIRA